MVYHDAAGFFDLSRPISEHDQNPKPDPVRKEREGKMLPRSRFLSFPMVIGAVLIGVVSGKAIFGPPLDEYWKKKLQEEANAKDTATKSS